MISAYDILMLIVFGGAILFGLWKGLAWQIASLAAVFVSYLVALTFRNQFAGLIPADPPWNQFIAMAILYLGASLAIWLAFGTLRRSIERLHLKEFDRQAGALLGAVKGALLCMVITMFAVTIPGDGARRAVIQSRSGNFIASSINRLSAIVPKELHAVLDPHFNNFNQRLNEPLPPQSAESQNGLWNFGGASTNQPTAGTNPVSGQLSWPVSVERDGQNGFRVQADPQELLNRGFQAIQDNAAGLPQNQTGGGWQGNR